MMHRSSRKESAAASPPSKGAPKCVVIGSGFGGLAAAVRLTARGYDVTVVEARDVIGGRAAPFQRGDFRFDAGPTVITAPYLFDELWALVGKERQDYFKLLPVDPYYRVIYPDGGTFDYVGEEERILENIRAIEPDDVDGYLALAKHAKEIFDIGYVKLAHVPFERLSDMMRVAPRMLQLKNHRSVYSLVAKYLKSPELRQAFSFQPLLVGGNPFRTSSIYLLIHWVEREWGVHFAEGGTGAIVEAFTKLLGELDVEIRTGTPVEEVCTKNGAVTGVRLASGETLEADIVVSNADPSVLYKTMLPASVRGTNTNRRINRVKQSMSLFVTYFGTNRTFPDLKHHSIVLGPRYQELLEDIFERKILASDFSLYLHRPSSTDPSMAPPGGDAFYVLSPVPNNASNISWETMHPIYERAILDSLEKVMPGLNKSIVTKFSVDPRYFANDLRSELGAAFGPEPRLTQSAYFRFHNRSPDVANLFFVGAGVHPGAGVPGVVTSAKVLDSVVPPASAF